MLMVGVIGYAIKGVKTARAVKRELHDSHSSHPFCRKAPAMKYHHLGIPTKEPRPGETYLESFKLYCTDHETNPFGIQWMRFDEDCPLPEIVQTLPHVAFEVDDLKQALQNREVLIAPNSPSPGVLVAFVLEDGVPVEFLEFL
jgi:hypothetical protein